MKNLCVCMSEARKEKKWMWQHINNERIWVKGIWMFFASLFNVSAALKFFKINNCEGKTVMTIKTGPQVTEWLVLLKKKRKNPPRLKLHSFDPKSSTPSSVPLHPGEWRDRQRDRVLYPLVQRPELWEGGRDRPSLSNSGCLTREIKTRHASPPSGQIGNADFRLLWRNRPKSPFPPPRNLMEPQILW